VTQGQTQSEADDTSKQLQKVLYECKAKEEMIEDLKDTLRWVVCVCYGVLRHFQQNFSYIVLVVEETGLPGENHRPASLWQNTLRQRFIIYCCKPINLCGY